MTEFLYNFDRKSGNARLSIVADNPELAEREHLGLMKSAIEDRLDGDLTSSEMHAVFQADPDDMPIAEIAKIIAKGDEDLVVDANGIYSISNGVDFFPMTDQKRDLEARLELDATAIELANNLGYTATAWQVELILDSEHGPQIASNRQYISLGEVDTIGDFTPIVTILPEDHPIRLMSIATTDATQK